MAPKITVFPHFGKNISTYFLHTSCFGMKWRLGTNSTVQWCTKMCILCVLSMWIKQKHAFLASSIASLTTAVMPKKNWCIRPKIFQSLQATTIILLSCFSSLCDFHVLVPVVRGQHILVGKKDWHYKSNIRQKGKRWGELRRQLFTQLLSSLESLLQACIMYCKKFAIFWFKIVTFLP